MATKPSPTPIGAVGSFSCAVVAQFAEVALAHPHEGRAVELRVAADDVVIARVERFPLSVEPHLLRAEMRTEMPDARRAPWMSRVAATATAVPKNLERARAMRAELEAIESVHALAETPAWQQAVDAVHELSQR